jgi:hypothetical protein
LSHTSTSSPLLGSLFDDASLFPPAALPMSDAVTGHIRHQLAWYNAMTGPFSCADAKLTELRTALTAANLAEIDLALIVTGGAGSVAAAVDDVAVDPRLRLRSVEVPTKLDTAADPVRMRQAVDQVLAALDAVRLAGAAGYAEIPLTANGADVLRRVEDHGYRPKLRTGGPAAAAFPDEPALAACLVALADRRLAFKCTAGLHHAIRHTAADTGFEHHGFLNLLLAVTAAADGAPADDVAAILADRDGASIAARVAGLDPQDASRARALLASVGTCSIDEPVADLVALGLASEPS